MSPPRTAPNEVWIVNASPCIAFAKADPEFGLLERQLLRPPGRQVFLPEEVIEEIRRGEEKRPDDLAVAALPLVTLGGHLLPPSAVDPRVDAFLIDAGEKAVLTAALARSRGGTTVVSVIDDRQARKAANALGINVTGSFGVLKIAKREGRLEAVAPALRAMKAAGINLPDDAEIRRRWLTPMGEIWP